MILNAFSAAALMEIGSEALKKLFSSFGDKAVKKVEKDFGGENNPVDEKLDMESSSLMDPAKRLVWDEISKRFYCHENDGLIIGRARRAAATTCRVNFAAMMSDPPTIKVEERDDKGKVKKTTYIPQSPFKPLATKLKEYCVDMFLAERQAQVGAGKSEEDAVKAAQEKVEIYLRSCGFPILKNNSTYQILDDFIVMVPGYALEAAAAAKKLLSTLVAKHGPLDRVYGHVTATLSGHDSEAAAIMANAKTPFAKRLAARRIKRRANR